MPSKHDFETIYMNFITRTAKAALPETALLRSALPRIDLIPFDPQGRVLVDVTLTPEQMNELMAEIVEAGGSFNQETESVAEGLARNLGRKPTATTTVSMDISHDPELMDVFYERLEESLIIHRVEKDANYKGEEERRFVSAALEGIKGQNKGSIIPLQQEMHFHLALTGRIYAKAREGIDPVQIQKAHQGAMLEINQLVMEAYARAIKTAMTDNGLDMGRLNRELDKARKGITIQGHNIFRKHFIKNTGVIFSSEELKKLNRKVAEITTATPNDVLHTSREQHLMTLIAGSESTAHNRVRGEQFAHRQIISRPMDEYGHAEKHNNPRLQIRTPSPVVKKGLESDQAYINDVADKLKAINQFYNLEDSLYDSDSRLLENSKMPRAFIYNSYTSFHNSPMTERLSSDPGNKNRQTQSARHILLGAHRYNGLQFKGEKSPDSDVREKNEHPVFCFVQNIPVNGFGNTLGYDSGNDLKEEITLMTDMALMYTLYESASEEEKGRIEQLMKEYQLFLKSRDEDYQGFFAQSTYGTVAKKIITDLKENWKNQSVSGVAIDVHGHAVLALKNLMAHNLHHQHEYSKLVQALSVFCEEASIGGCKSGNERAQAINGRVAVFDHLAHHHEDMELLGARLVALASGKDVEMAARAFNHQLNIEYNKFGLQGAASVISLVDQAGSAKVNPKEGSTLNTNYAEESASVMTNLHQKNASAMQAHKGLAEFMQAPWEELTFWNYFKKSFSEIKAYYGGGIFGSIASAIVTTLSSPFIFHEYAKASTEKETEDQNLLDEFASQASSHQRMRSGMRTADGANPYVSGPESPKTPTGTIAAPPEHETKRTAEATAKVAADHTVEKHDKSSDHSSTGLGL